MSGRNDLIQKIEQRVEMLQEMESEMQREKYALACDRQLLNALSIIGSLPEEVLIIIFKFHIKHTPLQVRDAFDTSIRLTHVCSRWRSIAVACPSLWNEINIFWPAWAKVFARRSLQLPLIVSSPAPHYSCYVYHQQLRQYLFKCCSHRITHLHIEAQNDRFDWLRQVLPDQLPTLRVLNLVSVEGGEEDQGPPMPTFVGSLPEIREISISGFCITVKQSITLSMFRPALRRLTLWLNESDALWHIAIRLPLRAIIAVLDNMPQLEYLVLKDVFDDDHGPLRAVIPRLATLSIRDTATRCDAFLRHISVDTLQVFNIHINKSPPSESACDLCGAIVDVLDRSPLIRGSLAEAASLHSRGHTTILAGSMDYLNTNISRLAASNSPRTTPLIASFDLEHHQMAPLVCWLENQPIQRLEVCIHDGDAPLSNLPFPLSVSELRLCRSTVRNNLSRILKPLVVGSLTCQPFPRLQKLNFIDRYCRRQEPRLIMFDPVLVQKSVTESFSSRSTPRDRPFELSYNRFQPWSMDLHLSLMDGIFSAYRRHEANRDGDEVSDGVKELIQSDMGEEPIVRQDFSWRDEWTDAVTKSSLTFKLWVA